MNVTILYAYPHDGGYNHAVLEAVQAGFSSRTDSTSADAPVHITTLDLYKEGFDPILRFDAEHRRRDLIHDPSTEKYRTLIEDSDLLVFIFPIWWSGMPAILKGFIDRVFVKGFAYRYKGILPEGLLKGKKAWIITSDDTPGWFARFFEPDYGKVLRHQILGIMCGIKTVRHDSMHYMRASTPRRREAFLQRVQRFASRIRA
ncbi:NADPH dehydrogenase [Alloscardovia macacae]|uniref:NADPH dehydrogenase n=1 Tax=Alloscardovia macacae TaxID=1160091 RepID=A0A1Y2SXJ9_9BIFI|nr:NAD(P)H-dependent oxidoreductase [Alloscardovia macacae]OTA26592.1 NADPH dehydrogenase [Alloscardovia macacae]OTA29021.1 NADPH dehydrogenase [Alloscardovia macacae]